MSEGRPVPILLSHTSYVLRHPEESAVQVIIIPEAYVLEVGRSTRLFALIFFLYSVLRQARYKKGLALMQPRW